MVRKMFPDSWSWRSFEGGDVITNSQESMQVRDNSGLQNIFQVNVITSHQLLTQVTTEYNTKSCLFSQVSSTLTFLWPPSPSLATTDPGAKSTKSTLVPSIYCISKFSNSLKPGTVHVWYYQLAPSHPTSLHQISPPKEHFSRIRLTVIRTLGCHH